MKVKIVGKEKITKKDTDQSWTSFQCVSDMKCSDKGSSTCGGVKVIAFMLDYEPQHDQLLIGKYYDCVMQEQLYRGVIQSRIVGLV